MFLKVQRVTIRGAQPSKSSEGGCLDRGVCQIAVLEHQGKSRDSRGCIALNSINEAQRDYSKRTKQKQKPRSSKSFWETLSRLSVPISRDIAILSLRYPISPHTSSGRSALRQNAPIPPHGHLVSHRHICAIPHFTKDRAIFARYPTETNTE